MYAASKLVGPELDPIGLLNIIIAGALASAGSSALNHYYDRDIDPLMKRTNTRPIPSGTIKAPTVLVIGLAIFFYVIIYTAWLKRKNSSNIVIGGFAGSAASMAGWTAATNFVPPFGIDLLGFLVGFLVFVWTPSHFWCLAMKIREDYAEARVPMLPVLIGMQKTSKYILINTAILLPYSLMLVAFGLGYVYLVIAAVSGGMLFV